MAEKDEKSVGIVKTQIMRAVEADKPLELECGKSLGPIDVAYETYGKLNEKHDNAIFMCHALSGNAHVAGYNSADDKKPGWWDVMVGPGKGIDTNKYFVICSNFLGGCSGTTGPTSTNPATGKPYGLSFPIITVADMVKVQKLLVDKLGIKQLLSVVGGSIGGMQVLQWTLDYPALMKSAIVVASTSRLGAQSIAFDAVGRNAILADPNFEEGNYREKDKVPNRGLGIARMIGHITYLSEHGMHEKFGRELQGSESYSYDFNSEFAVETYLAYKGQSFVERFDANSYLYITKAMDYFDVERDYGSLKNAFTKVKCRYLVISFASDWLFTPQQSEAIVNGLFSASKDVSFCNIQSPYGHDAFLLEPEIVGGFVSGFLTATDSPKSERRKELESTLQQREANKHEEGRRSRVDYELIESLIESGSTVLDIGCGDGELLAHLENDKGVKGKGIEVDEESVMACVKRGISIIQHDIERGLETCGDKSFDYVILSQTVQTLKNPEKVFAELLRVGKKVIVSFPNFGHWRCRLQLLLRGKAPVTKQLPFAWHDTPNIHFLSLKDFDEFCGKLGVRVEKKIPLAKRRRGPACFLPNLFAEDAIYVTSRD